MDYYFIGASPKCAPGAQIGSEDYEHIAKMECQIYLNQLKRQYGHPPAGCEFKVLEQEQVCGYYYEVAIFFDSEREHCVAFAIKVEAGCNYWDAISKRALQAI